jgi:Ca2+-transporting ATPase
MELSDPGRHAAAGEVLEAAVLASRATRDHGDPTEVAIVAGAVAAGIDPEQARRTHPLLTACPFDSFRKRMTLVRSAENGTIAAYVKGAANETLALCETVRWNGRSEILTDARRRAILAGHDQLAAAGLRILAVAGRPLAEPPAEASMSAVERGLTFLGLVALWDPPRPEVQEALQRCRNAGIRVVVITGDYGLTARAIAATIGLSVENVVTGDEVERLAPEALQLVVARPGVLFARASPAHKLAIAQALRRCGEVVAMTGDGVNDAPALRKADIGVAMGRRGTEVARQAAAMVLRDDSFATIVAAIREGRIIFANIRRFVLYLLACNLSEVMVVAIAMAAGLPLPLLPLQILFLNLVTDVFPAFALAMSEGGGDVMRRPPRNPAEPIVTGPLWTLVAAQGFAMTLATLAAMALARDGIGLEGGAVVTVSFLTLALAQIWHTFNMADPGPPLLVNDVTRNPYVWGAVIVCLALIGAACYVPSLAEVLKLTPPDAATWGIVLATSLSAMVLGRAIVAGLGRFLRPSSRGAQAPAHR